MNYKKMTAFCLAVNMLFAAQAMAADKQPAPIKNAQAEKQLQKNMQNQQVTVKEGRNSGMQIVTENKQTANTKQPANVQKDNKQTANVKQPANVQKDNKQARNKPAVSTTAPKASASSASSAKPKQSAMLTEKDGKSYFLGTELPPDYKSISIYGDSVATRSQAVGFIKQSNPNVRLACSVDELVQLYWQEAEREGVRPDLALSQSLVETGTYAYGGDVTHNQNNFCGLGTTGGGVKGASFATPELGVRAHIQHLLAYTQKKRPQTEIVDPRYELAHKIRLERGVVDTWYGLNGTWAMGSLYCEKIMATYQKMLAMPSNEPKEQKQPVEKKKLSMRERIAEIMKEK